MSELPDERRPRFWWWYVVAGVLFFAGEVTRRFLSAGYGYALIVSGIALWIVYVLLDGFSAIERKRTKRRDRKSEKTVTPDSPFEGLVIQPDPGVRPAVKAMSPYPLRQETGDEDDGRPTLRWRFISGLLGACVFGGAKWSDVPTADGVFWVVVALGFAFGWFGWYG